MEEYLSKAQRYRAQAARLRDLAAKEHDEPTRKAMTSLAESYDRLFLKYGTLANEPWPGKK